MRNIFEEVAAKLRQTKRQQKPQGRGYVLRTGLTAQEIRVAQELANDIPIAQISLNIGRSQVTVRKLADKVRIKTGSHTKCAAIARLVQLKVITVTLD
jgi:DNA-binding CsgD family transcriptional regulator